jgi:nucleoside-diphosphate-sugar epimerase
MNKILVLGATGFVGKATIEALLKQNIGEIHALYHRRAPQFPQEITIHKADIFDRKLIEAIFYEIKPTHLVQLAWCAEHGTYWKDHANFDWLSVNLDIARYFKKYGGTRCVFLGTSAEYDWSGKFPLSEITTPLKPQMMYGATKLGLYWALSGFFQQENISWAWARLFNPFGPFEHPGRLIPKTCLRLLKGETLYFDAALSVRDFLYVGDVGNAIAAILFSPVNGAINVASGIPVTINEVVSAIASNYNCDNKVFFDKPATDAHIDSVVADTTRLYDECNWRPEMDFLARLKQTCDWWRENALSYQ